MPLPIVGHIVFSFQVAAKSGLSTKGIAAPKLFGFWKNGLTKVPKEMSMLVQIIDKSPSIIKNTPQTIGEVK